MVGTPSRTSKTYLPGTGLCRLLLTSDVAAGPLSRNAPGTPEPGSSKKVPGFPVPCESPARADVPPVHCALPPLAWPVSHRIWS